MDFTPRIVNGNRRSDAGSILTLLILAAIMACHPAAGGSNLVTGDLAIAGKDVTWAIKNEDNDAITITSISVTWPEQNGRLQKIYLDNTNILDKERDPPQILVEGNLPGQQKKYALNPGQTSIFGLSFQNPASSLATDYHIQVDFDAGSVQYPTTSPSACSIIGPDTVCESEEIWLSASIIELPSYSYTYDWKIDGGDAGTEKSILIGWESYAAGMHTVSLDVAETSGAATYHIQTSKQVLVVKKPIVKITVRYKP